MGTMDVLCKVDMHIGLVSVCSFALGRFYIDLENEEMESTYPAALFDRDITDGRAMLPHRLRRAHRPRRARAHRRSGVQHRPAADRVHRCCLHQADCSGVLHRPEQRGGGDRVPAPPRCRGLPAAWVAGACPTDSANCRRSGLPHRLAAERVHCRFPHPGGPL